MPFNREAALATLTLLGWEPIHHPEIIDHLGWRNVGEKRYLFIGEDGTADTQWLYSATYAWPVRTTTNDVELQTVLEYVGRP